MLDQRRRHWADVVQMSYKCFVFAGDHYPEQISVLGLLVLVPDRFGCKTGRMWLVNRSQERTDGPVRAVNDRLNSRVPETEPRAATFNTSYLIYRQVMQR